MDHDVSRSRLWSEPKTTEEGLQSRILCSLKMNFLIGNELGLVVCFSAALFMLLQGSDISVKKILQEFEEFSRSIFLASICAYSAIWKRNKILPWIFHPVHPVHCWGILLRYAPHCASSRKSGALASVHDYHISILFWHFLSSCRMIQGIRKCSSFTSSKLECSLGWKRS